MAVIVHRPVVGADSAPARPQLSAALKQVALLSVAAGLYFGVRNLTHGDAATAFTHADSVMALEERLGLHREGALQELILGHHSLITVFNDIYIYGHWPVIVVALVWLFARHRAQFVVARNALLLSGAVALPVFALFPVAPPRFADPGVLDLVTLHDKAYRVLQPPSFTNLFAAMPSLHAGWDLVIGLAVAAAVSHRWLSRLVRALPLLMVAAVILTGNHYVVDALVGDLLAVSSYLFVRQAERCRGSHVEAVDAIRRQPV